MKCSCGGELKNAHLQKTASYFRAGREAAPDIPDEVHLQMASFVAMARPGFICVECGRHFSLNSAIMENMFPLQRMPDGVPFFFDKGLVPESDPEPEE